ncbi:hypothetical protein TcG_11318 [Trypanosoma cruzi]|nr:hypothetical protein TcG_11318 [Trypanosoma cruzi]
MRRGPCDGRAFLPAAEAEHRRRPNSTAAQPIPVSGNVAPPCLGASQAWAREGTKLLCTDLQQHGETTAEGMIAVLPLAYNFSSGQAAAATHSACYIPSVQIHVGMSRLPLVRCLGASPTMWSQRPETLHTPRCKHSSQLHAGQGQHFSVVAACLSVAGGRPPSPQCGMADGDPSPCKQVDVQWETRSTHCAVTSGTRRGGRCSTLPVPDRRTAQSPCRLRWRRGPLLPPLKASNRPAAHGVDSGHPQWALQSQGDECCSQGVKRGQLTMEGCRGSPGT